MAWPCEDLHGVHARRGLRGRLVLGSPLWIKERCPKRCPTQPSFDFAASAYKGSRCPLAELVLKHLHSIEELCPEQAPCTRSARKNMWEKIAHDDSQLFPSLSLWRWHVRASPEQK